MKVSFRGASMCETSSHCMCELPKKHELVTYAVSNPQHKKSLFIFVEKNEFSILSAGSTSHVCFWNVNNEWAFSHNWAIFTTKVLFSGKPPSRCGVYIIWF